MGFRKKECRASLVLARKVVRRWSLICTFCKVSPLGTPRLATRSGVRNFSLERADAPLVTRLEAEDSSSPETLQGLREIIRKMRFATRFSALAENSKRPRLRLKAMGASFPE